MLLLDEPTEGLAPVIVQRIGEVLVTLKARGMTILLVEQNFRFARRSPTASTSSSTARWSSNFRSRRWPSAWMQLHEVLGV